MKVVCLAFLIVQCSCSYSGNNLRIPSVAELTASGGSLGNIGSNGQNDGGASSISNIANIAQSNIGSLGSGNLGNGQGNLPSIGNVATVIQTNIDTGSGDSNSGDGSSSGGDENTNNDGQSSSDGSQTNVGNIANIAQSNDGSQSGIGNLGTVVQTNINTGQLNSIGNIGNIAQSNIGGSQGTLGNIGNIANIGQSNIGGSQGTLGGIGNIANIGQSNIGGTQGILGNIGNIANIGQSNIVGSQGILGSIGNIANIGQSNIGGILNNLYVIGQNNEDRYIERPCQVFDTHCIRKYLSENSKCKEIYGPVPDPIYRGLSTQQLPRVNVTFTAHDARYSGLNGRIEEFYINRETDRVVLAIEFRNLTFYSKTTYFRFYRNGREPIITADYTYFNYPSILTTIVIPNRKHLQLQKSEVYTYVNGRPSFAIGPRVFNVQDQTVQQARIELLDNVDINTQETQVTEGAYYAPTYIQHALCDFGLKIL